jgi:hypothetical protein
LWIGSTPGREQEFRPVGQPLLALLWAGVSDTESFVLVQPPWNVW